MTKIHVILRHEHFKACYKYPHSQEESRQAKQLKFLLHAHLWPYFFWEEFLKCSAQIIQHNRFCFWQSHYAWHFSFSFATLFPTLTSTNSFMTKIALWVVFMENLILLFWNLWKSLHFTVGKASPQLMTNSNETISSFYWGLWDRTGTK